MTTAELDGTMWRLIEARAWDEDGRPLPAPYGGMPVGQIMFLNGRMLASLCNGDREIPGSGRGFSSYGGFYTFDGTTLTVRVDVASDATRIGGLQERGVVLEGACMRLRPGARLYGRRREQRELTWECVWRATEVDGAGA